MGEPHRPFYRTNKFPADHSADCGHHHCDQGLSKGLAGKATRHFCGLLSRIPVIDPSCCDKDVGKVFILAAVLDSIYQLIVHRGVYVLELLITARVLAIIP